MAASEEMRFKRNVKGHTSQAYQPPTRTPEPGLIAEAARLLAECRKIAILAGSGARGEVNRQRIGLSIGRHAVQEFTFSESPFGVAGRLVEKLTGQKGETEKE